MEVHNNRINHTPQISFLTRFCIAACIILFSASNTFAQQQQQLVPARVQLSGLVSQIINDPLIKPDEKIKLQRFHGQFDSLPQNQQNTPQTLLAKFDLKQPIFQLDSTPSIIRAEIAHLKGEHAQVLTLLKNDNSIKATLLKGHAYAGLGDTTKAIEQLTPLRNLKSNPNHQSAEDQVNIASALITLATLQGRPADDYQQIIDMLTNVHQKIDRFHWPAVLLQAQLLMEKDSLEPGIKALHEVLKLNPKSSEAWFMLGSFAARTFDFDGAERAVEHLYTINENHIFGLIIEIESALTQKNTKAASELVQTGLNLYPRHRHLLALNVATAAVAFDKTAEAQALERFNKVASKNPLAHALAGRFLSLTRQYDLAIEHLGKAIQRQPNWPEPQIELGWVLSQAGYETRSLQVLKGVSQLDPFNLRAQNTLKLLEALSEYKTIETDHFIIRYKDGIDAALAHDMPKHLEQMYDELSTLYEIKIARKTQIEILPNMQYFAVRITGMPDIWTIAACTGPVVALTPPREGKGQHGYFDWRRVMRHEYTHTITLAKTKNRIPHWMTEAIAVQEEQAPRTLETCQMLTNAYYDNELFDLSSVNWAFVRPRKPHHRSLAYAQSNWMTQYITHKFGHKTLLKILDLSAQGTSQYEVIKIATGVENDQFIKDFKAWALLEIQSWGLTKQKNLTEQLDQLAIDGELTIEKLNQLLQSNPKHRQLLKRKAELLLTSIDPSATETALKDYATAVPVDTWAYEQLALFYEKQNNLEKAAEQLIHLDSIEQTDGRYAKQLVTLFRELKDHQNAWKFAERVVQRQAYDGTARETAALAALRAGQKEQALHHLTAMTFLEPDRDIHFARLAAMHSQMGNTQKAKDAATQALKLNPQSPAKKFLD